MEPQATMVFAALKEYALMAKNVSGVGLWGIFLCLPALGEEGSEHDGARKTQLLATEVSFGH